LYILRILMMIPVSNKELKIKVYSVMTWLSIMMPVNALYFNTVRDM